MTLENIVYACYEELEQPRPTGRTRIPLQPSGFLTLGCIGTAI